jgi:hypothetical protein
MLAWLWTAVAPPDLKVHFPVAGPVDDSQVVPPLPGGPQATASSTPSSVPSSGAASGRPAKRSATGSGLAATAARRRKSRASGASGG